MFKRVSNGGEVVTIDDFLQDANQVPILPPRKKYRTLSRVVSGKAITEDSVFNGMISHANSKSSNQAVPSTSNTGKDKDNDLTSDPQVALTSNANNNEGCDVEDDNDLCCVCGSFYVKSARNKSQLAIVNWAQCVNGQCNHWVYLKYCTEVRHFAQDESFLCPHCIED